MNVHVYALVMARINNKAIVIGCVVWLMLAPFPGAAAAGWQFGGHLKYQLTQSAYRTGDVFAAAAGRHPLDQSVDFRLKAQRHWGPWSVQAHYEVLGLFGDSVAALEAFQGAGALNPTATLPRDTRRLFNLTGALGDGERFTGVQRLDRLSLSYSAGPLVLRVGRQAISWGDGLVFNPLDVFNPFSPVAVDKSYKTGDDMVYGQWLWKNGDDLQGVYVPRRDPATGDVEWNQSSLALKQHILHGDTEYDLLAAMHYGQPLLGFGTEVGWHGAVWRLDVGAERLAGGGTAGLLVTNIDRSWVWAQRNVYGYLEYFRDSLGSTGDYAHLNPGLLARLTRGELYTLGRDYLAGGLQVEWTPRLNLYATLIRNLDDTSGFIQLRARFDWEQNLAVSGGLNLPAGPPGSEFGGVVVPEGYNAPARSLYVRIEQYF